MLDDADLVSARRDYAPAADLAEAAAFAFEKASETPEGSFYELLTAILMSALAFEAVLNQAGVHLWGSESARWAAIERARPMDKLRAIGEQADFPLRFGQRPLQTVSELMTLRNDIVHGKPRSFEAEIPRGVAKASLSFRRVPGLSPKWEQLCTLQFAERAIQDVDQMTADLCVHIGMANPILFGGGSGYHG